MNIKTIISIMAITAATMPSFGQEKLQSGIPLENLDRSARPGDDFYQFACGGWIKNNPLPAAYSRFGSFDRLQQDNNERINGILTELQKNKYDKGTVEQKLSDFYKLAMDSTRRNKEGVKPIMPLIKQIENCKNMFAIIKWQQEHAAFGYGVPYSAWFGADEKNAKMNILNINQSGLTLGMKDYYLDSHQGGLQKTHRQHVPPVRIQPESISTENERRAQHRDKTGRGVEVENRTA